MSGCWSLAACFWQPQMTALFFSGYWLLVTGCWLHVSCSASSKKQEASSQLPVASSQKPEASSQRFKIIISNKILRDEDKP